eukprot:CAMPEP_0185597628 /NCGR_PEP_ID=MMETSP0434-20130131/81484_1 /TAXON_ID=626734 ORGANISM="Favella taraikaensis, Strain Fe Narragansett Bay" /NCGR_SAMPLE_ID=MMETSP0434 /ASSEMBLY_ACC=CAM_ASM_000379 /LENGTH=93 /DNA_ID=CAMNT_0028226395 /DNA_START=2732 /DNA_END=3013 /DNA_ORIENTATION=-
MESMSSMNEVFSSKQESTYVAASLDVNELNADLKAAELKVGQDKLVGAPVNVMLSSETFYPRNYSPKNFYNNSPAHNNKDSARSATPRSDDLV